MKNKKKYPPKGYRRIRKRIVVDTGWVVSRWLVHSVCKELDIKYKAGRYQNKKTTGKEHVIYPRIIKEWYDMMFAIINMVWTFITT